MSKNFKIFLRSLYISSVVFFCLFIGIYGISRAYESIRLIGFGEYRDAIEITENEIKIFDYEIQR